MGRSQTLKGVEVVGEWRHAFLRRGALNRLKKKVGEKSVDGWNEERNHSAAVRLESGK